MDLLSGAISELSTVEIEEMIEIPSNTEMGDYAFPCFRLAKVFFRKAPNMIASDIGEKKLVNRNMYQILKLLVRM